MVEVSYSPYWFFGKDAAIDIISAVILLSIAWLSYRYYCMDKAHCNERRLSISFAVLALAFIAKLFTDILVHARIQMTIRGGVLAVTTQMIEPMHTYFLIGLLAYQFLMLAGLFLLFSIQHPSTRLMKSFVLVLLLCVTYFSLGEYLIFHILTLMLAVLVTISYYVIYRTKRILTTKIVLVAFALFSVSRLLFLFLRYNSVYYALAEVLQLAAFLILLLALLRVVFYAKKKVQA